MDLKQKIVLEGLMLMRINKSDNIDFEIPIDFNMKYIDYDIKFDVYQVRYTYDTNRHNRRENHKYVIANDYEDAKLKFINYINDFNEKKKYRAISNVKILDVELLGTVTKQIYNTNFIPRSEVIKGY